MDFVEGLPRSEGRSVILVVVDRLTKYAHFMGLAHPYTAVQVARTYIDHVLKLHGLPKTIVSDRDRVFLSSFWQELFCSQGVALHISSAYHPQSDGQTEVVNRGLECYLHCMCSKCPSKWLQWLPLAEWWYITTHHSAINCSPYQALYGRPPPIHIPYVPGDSANAAVDSQLRDQEAMIKELQHQLRKTQQQLKQQADKRRSERVLEPGQWVYLKLQPYRQQTFASRNNHKLSPRYYSPYMVLEKIGKVAYRLDLLESTRTHPVFHVSLLKPALGPPIEVIHIPTNWSTEMTPRLVAILSHRLVQRGRKAVTQVLTQWSNGRSEDATWEYLFDLKLEFPEWNLEDKVSGRQE